MRWQFVIFFSVFFTIYGLVNFYILRRAYQSLEVYPQVRLYFIVWFVVSAVVYFIGRWLENYFLNVGTDILVWYGAFWLGLIVYAFFSVVIIDLARSVLLIINHDLSHFINNYAQFKFNLGLGVSILILAILGLGYLNANHPQTKELNINIDKIANKKEWHIVAVSDIHLGSIVDRKRAASLVSSINKLSPDLVLLVGDTIDEDLAPVKRQDIGESLKNIQANYGVYAVTGNHEYIGGVEAAVDYLEQHNITVLQDQSIVVGGELVLIGRKDKMSDSMKLTKRANLSDLLSNINTSKPILLMDHEPFKLPDVASDGRVDLQLSGHTHHGQLWPFNFITRAMYEISWGYKKINNTNFYVSSGWGTWGPPLRVGNTPELLSIKLHLK